VYETQDISKKVDTNKTDILTVELSEVNAGTASQLLAQ
jgi:hypothetical protein